MPEPSNIQHEANTLYKDELVDLLVRDGVAQITIHRPKALNALNENVIEQLTHAFHRALEYPETRGIVFSGEGKAFVAGADIRFFIDRIRQGKIPEIENFTRKGHELFLAIENSEKPTIAMLDGLSLGGGSEMALACQAIITTPDGVMGFPETGIGIIPGLGGMFRMARHVGVALAKYYVFTGELLRAKDIYDLGIATRFVEPERIWPTVVDLLEKPLPNKYRHRVIPERFKDRESLFQNEHISTLLEGKSPFQEPQKEIDHVLKKLESKSLTALRLANEILDRQGSLSIKESVEIELSQLSRIFGSQDALEGLSAAIDGN